MQVDQSGEGHEVSRTRVGVEARELAEKQLEEMLIHVADAYDQQIEVRVGALTSILEPLLIVVMGAVVGGIAFAILMPLLQLNEMIQ